MKKIIALAILFFFNTSVRAQDISYGLVVGGLYYQSNNNNGTYGFYADEDYFSPNIGGYLEYNFNQQIGLKTEITYNKRELTYYYEILHWHYEIPNIEFSFIELSPNLKYDFGDQYREGFYLLFGPRLSFMTSNDADNFDEIHSIEKINFGLQLGLGQRLFKFIDIQGKFDYGITPFFKSNDDKKNSKFFGAYVTLNVDLEKLIN